MNKMTYMKQELERLGTEVSLIEDVSSMSLYDNELEETVCYVTADDKENLDIFLLYDMYCVCNFFNRLSIHQLYDRVRANTKKNIKKFASQYVKSKNIVLKTCKDCKSVIESFNSAIDDYSKYESDYKVKAFACTLKKELDKIIRQAYRINKLGE